ncbi:MAG: alkaline phosphatase [SAR86 cluster bacterium]|uniref:Alkaline phosphatase n=1 Tax=SAR86 cluster bacterium TaxID=2030880 RepID=A0A838XWS0_9GAMM|nr:alkaline phosphatase [SAR86 cluster bacterium]|tara:strand:- start:9965 stop:11104 length:1140 start_codon:yes stop_codon:yes gene_type:complete
MKKSLLILSTFMLFACGSGDDIELVSIGSDIKLPETLKSSSASKAKNIILLIGDGMGPNQVALARFATGGPDHRLSFENFPITGIVYNHSSDSLYTDSAASATAWATGVKTKNRYLAVDAEKKFLPTIPELLSAKGYKSGLVANSSITHATPAAFYAHIDSRYKEKEIAKMLIDSDIDIALGGGQEFFDVTASQDSPFMIYDKRLLDSTLLNSKEQVIGLFAEDGFDREKGTPTQLEMTQVALSFLKKKSQNCSGFFLMSEGSQIDWAGHDNNVEYMLIEFADFEATVLAATNFALANQDTLILVTADHATGGLVLQRPKGSKVQAQWTTGSHDLSPVNIYAYGPGAELFSGVMDNTEIFDRILQALDYENLDSSNCSN